jgi:hypothetical protein
MRTRLILAYIGDLVGLAAILAACLALTLLAYAIVTPASIYVTQ